jgi:hypothetical protein
LVALSLAIVAGREGLGLLVPGLLANDVGEVAGALAGPVISDDAVDVDDAVGTEPCPGSDSRPRWLLFSSSSGSV